MLISRLASAFAAVLLCTSASAASATDARTELRPPGIRIEMTREGPVFADRSGKTLYTLAMDTTGESMCTDRIEQVGTSFFGPTPLPEGAARTSCVDRTPPLLAPADAKPVGQWTIGKRADGRLQWKYGGFPVYTSRRDTQPGQIRELPLYFKDAVPVKVPFDAPPGLKVEQTGEGGAMLLGDRPVYYNADAGASCTGHCEREWKPVLAGEMAKAHGKWSVVNRADGRRQWAFDSHPLFTPIAEPDAPPPSSSWFSRALTWLASLVSSSDDWQRAMAYTLPPLPAAIGSQASLLGPVYSTRGGLTLYRYLCRRPTTDMVACDEQGDSATFFAAICGTADDCAKRFRPYLAAPEDRSSGAWAVEDVAWPPYRSTTGRLGEGVPTVRAWTYDGRPVLTYREDKVPGDTWAHAMAYPAIAAIFAIQVPGAAE